MQILTEPIVCFDTDDTLIVYSVPGGAENHPDAIQLPCGNLGPLYVVPHRKHIEYLKKLKSDGFKIVVWSWAGTEWVTEVVRALKLEPYVDLIMAKPEELVDDLPVEEVFKRITYFPFEG